MLKGVEYVLLGLGLMISTIGNAQKITEGVFEYGIISYEVTKDSIDGEALQLPTIEQMKQKIPNMTMYFTPNRLAITVEDLFDSSIDRAVFDLDNGKEYEFKTVAGEKSFTVNDIKSNVEERNSFPADIFGEKRKLSEKIFNLNCIEHKKNLNGSTIEIITTNDISLPNNSLLNQTIITDNGVLISAKTINLQLGMNLTVGMKSFSPIIADKDILSIDTVGMVNIKNVQKEIYDEINEYGKSEKQKNEKFKNETPPSPDKVLIQKMVDQGILDLEVSSVSYALNDNDLSDIPTLLLAMNRSKKGLGTMDRKIIKDRFSACNILTKEVDKLLSLEDSVWGKIPEDYRVKAIALAMIKDHLNSEKTKKQIIENFDRLNYGDFSNHPAGLSYISGNLSLKDFLSELPFLDKLYIGIAANEDEAYQHINSFFSTAFTSLDLDVKITRNGKIVTLDDGVYKHYLDLTKLNKGSAYRPTYDESTKEFIEFTSEVYQDLRKFVIQISADNDNQLAFNIFHLNPPFISKIDRYDYLTIIEANPSLVINQEAVYFYTTPSKDIIEDFIGTSFPYHPNNLPWEVSLGDPTLRNSHTSEYLTTKKKMEFTTYLTKYQKAFGLDKKTLTTLIKEIEASFFPDTETLLEFLPESKLIVSEGIPSNEGYSPKFTEDKNHFKDVYPRIYAIIGDDFQARNFKYNPDTHKISFSYNNQQHSINPGEESMADFLKEEFKKSTSAKQLYRIIKLGLVEVEYFYLTPQQKKDISEIVPIKF